MIQFRILPLVKGVYNYKKKGPDWRYFVHNELDPESHGETENREITLFRTRPRVEANETLILKI